MTKVTARRSVATKIQGEPSCDESQPEAAPAMESRMKVRIPPSPASSSILRFSRSMPISAPMKSAIAKSRMTMSSMSGCDRGNLHLRVVDRHALHLRLPRHGGERLDQVRVQVPARLVLHDPQRLLGGKRIPVRPLGAERVIDIAHVHQLARKVGV